MALDGLKPVFTNLDMQDTAKLKNLPQGSSNGDAVNVQQLNTGLAAKQNNLAANNGLAFEGSNLNVDLATAGSDYSALTLSGAFYASLNGAYTRAAYNAFLDYSGTSLDLNYGGEYSFYYKDNGGGVWAVIGKREVDGIDDGSDTGEWWLACLVTTDPTSVTSTVINFIPNYQAVDYEVTAIENELDGSNYVPKTGSYLGSTVGYGVGSVPAGLKFVNSKLAVDFANSTTEASSTKMFPSSVVKTYIDEQIVEAKDLSNHGFNNAVAGISNNPNNAQSALEALADEIDAVEVSLNSANTVNANQTSNIGAINTTMGVTVGDTDLGAFASAGAVFLRDAATPTVDPTNVKEALENVATSFQQVYQNVGTINGLGFGETDFGGGFTILSNNAAAKVLFQEIETELQSLAAGAGATWASSTVQVAVETNVNISNPATSVFAGVTVTNGQVILLADQTDATESGFYVFDTDSTPLVRWANADASEDFIQNRSVQVVEDGSVWAYNGSADPTLGTDDLSFQKIRESIIADDTITEQKLAPDVLTILDTKVQKYVGSFTSDVSGEVVLTHNLGEVFYSVTVLDDANEQIVCEIINSNNTAAIGGLAASTDYKYVIVG